jgi:hypothetical protein
MLGKLLVVVRADVRLRLCAGADVPRHLRRAGHQRAVAVRAAPQAAGWAAQGQGNTQVDTTRTITVEFDANARGPWDFKPAQRSLQVHPGEMATVMYEFSNVQNRTMAAQAIPSYAPRRPAALQQARVLLLQRVHAGPGRVQAVAGGVRHRPQAAART